MGMAVRKKELEREIKYRDDFWPLDPRTDSLRRELATLIETDRDQGMTGSHDEDDQPHFFDSGDVRGAERYDAEEAMIELVQEQAVEQLVMEMAELDDIEITDIGEPEITDIGDDPGDPGDPGDDADAGDDAADAGDDGDD